MTSIADSRLACVLAGGDKAAWRAWAERIRSWLDEQGLDAGDPRLSDVVVLLPFAAHLPLAKRAWADTGGGWMPRMETTRTLLDRVAPPVAAEPGRLSGEPVTDRLIARSLLLREGWARDWQRRDARGFEQALGRLVETAQAVARARAATRPDQRAAFDAQARETVAAAAPASPGARERLLAALAVEWALATSELGSDALF
ncbi:MAG: hypothetical protein MK041_09965, partial [Aquabacterium sp.]|nr:hypothetical protein [Aquabacterium sp.]